MPNKLTILAYWTAGSISGSNKDRSLKMILEYFWAKVPKMAVIISVPLRDSVEIDILANPGPKVTDPLTKSLIGDTDSGENSYLMLIIDSH